MTSSGPGTTPGRLLNTGEIMSSRHKKIFVIDDDPAIRRALRRLLTAEGYEVKTFDSAREFLRLRYPEAPACLILDVRMPRMSGLELQRRLAEEGLKIPIIFISGHGDDETAAAALEAGAVDFLHKPLPDHQLLDIVKRVVGKNPA
jgi:FixJ family two-component response regulator